VSWKAWLADFWPSLSLAVTNRSTVKPPDTA
jgi:hypothetical protein